MTPALTPRQREVVQLLVEGNTYADISRVLDISPRTVRQHIQRVADHLTGTAPPLHRVLVAAPRLLEEAALEIPEVVHVPADGIMVANFYRAAGDEHTRVDVLISGVWHHYERWRLTGVNHAGHVIQMDIADAFSPTSTGAIRIGSEVHELVSWHVVRESRVLP